MCVCSGWASNVALKLDSDLAQTDSHQYDHEEAGKQERHNGLLERYEPLLIAELAVALGTYEGSATRAAAVYLGFKAAALTVQCAADWNQFGAMPVRVNKTVGTWALGRLMAAPIALINVGTLQSIAAGADTWQLGMACMTAFQIAAVLARIVASAALQAWLS